MGRPMNRLMSAGAVFLAAVLLIVGIVAVSPGEGSTASDATTGDFRVDEPNGNVVEVDLVARETTQEVAPDVKYQVWTFNGTAPGPVIRVQLGDTVRFTLTNDTSIGMQHSIDFHAALTPWDKNYQPVDPGETLTFDWVAMYPGVFMYHCGVDPVLQHIGNGMYGAIIVETDALPAEREFVLVASEFYPGAKPIDGVYVGDLDRMKAVEPEYVVFDGLANRYLESPLAGPSRRALPDMGGERRADAHERLPRDRHALPARVSVGEPDEPDERAADVEHPARRRRDVRAADPRRRGVSLRDPRLRLHGPRFGWRDPGQRRSPIGARLVPDVRGSVLRRRAAGRRRRVDA